jgi:hypothetical protein
MPLERAAVFVDGNNWYHALRRAGLTGLGWLNYAKVSNKLVGAREWTTTRYYVGRVQQTTNMHSSMLTSGSTCLGSNPATNVLASTTAA